MCVGAALGPGILPGPPRPDLELGPAATALPREPRHLPALALPDPSPPKAVYLEGRPPFQAAPERQALARGRDSALQLRPLVSRHPAERGPRIFEALVPGFRVDGEKERCE